MYYLTQAMEIRQAIAQFEVSPCLWVDTETADWWTHAPRLSLIQVLANPDERTSGQAYVLDVMDQDDLIDEFIDRIMTNCRIEKVFHNASYDLKFLGANRAENITCTLKLARSLGGAKKLGTTNLKLKTLAVELAQFQDVDTEEQSSNWGIRSLSRKQLHYAAMDVVYLAAIHQQLMNARSASVLV